MKAHLEDTLVLSILDLVLEDLELVEGTCSVLHDMNLSLVSCPTARCLCADRLPHPSDLAQPCIRCLPCARLIARLRPLDLDQSLIFVLHSRLDLCCACRESVLEQWKNRV